METNNDLNRCVTSLTGPEPVYSIDDARLELAMESSRNRSLASVDSPVSLSQNGPWDYQYGFGSRDSKSFSRKNPIGKRQQPDNIKGTKSRIFEEARSLALSQNDVKNPVRNCSVSLREWLRSESSSRVEKAEKLWMFRQIVKLVDFAHSRGSSLQDLRPSCFAVSLPSNRIRYTGSLLTRRNTNTNTENGVFGDLNNRKRPLGTTPFEERFSKLPKLGERLGNSLVTEQQQAIGAIISQLEKKWYSNESGCAFSSNVYGLGILLFELLCCCESWESHSAIMFDLQHRILPGKFLSENPIESAFCLRLLHPEASSRPTTREILQSELMSGPQDSSCVDDSDPQSELLIEFLSSLKEEKESRTSKLLQDFARLEEDINIIKQRCSVSSSNHKEFSTKNEDRLMKNMAQLEKTYFEMRSSQSTEDDNDHFGAFFDGLCKFGRFREFKVCGTLRNGDLFNSTNAICSLSFDRDEEFIATAKVSKKIKIFEFGSLLNDSADIHYPVVEMSNSSKLSCISWNSYIKNYLASTDYDGTVKMWDTGTGKGFAQYTEHKKRAWSVDFSRADPTMFVSGSDDCSVRLWSVNDKSSIGTIWSPANVCCVQFSDFSSHQFVFGSADYKIYGYDLRHVRVPLWAFSGHGKAVSYVKFVDSETLVSASTDNTLKLWNLRKNASDSCTLTFTGHTNEKNFVGLSVLDGYIVCGSETNEVYSYCKSLPMPITSHKFKTVDPISGDEISEDSGQFVSSVCWRRKSNMVVAANSSGVLKLLQMV